MQFSGSEWLRLTHIPLFSHGGGQGWGRTNEEGGERYAAYRHSAPPSIRELNPRDQDHEVSRGFSSHIPKEHSVTAVDATCGRSGKLHCAMVHSTLIRLLSHPLTPHPAAHPSSEPTGNPTLQKSTGGGLGGCSSGPKHLLRSMHTVLYSVSKTEKQTNKNKQTNKSEMDTYSFIHSVSAA